MNRRAQKRFNTLTILWEFFGNQQSVLATISAFLDIKLFGGQKLLKDYANYVPHVTPVNPAIIIANTNASIVRMIECGIFDRHTNNGVAAFQCSHCRSMAYQTETCVGCGLVRYCSTSCQRQDWNYHKLVCRFLRTPTADELDTKCTCTKCTTFRRCRHRQRRRRRNLVQTG
jgi:hypothetical protein